MDDELDIYIRTSFIFVLSVLFNFCFVLFFFYIILTMLVYFLGLFLFVPRHQNSTKMEVEKIVQEKTEMQRHYVMVSTGHLMVFTSCLYILASSHGFCMYFHTFSSALLHGNVI